MTAQILIADRDPLVRSHASRYLTARGYDVSVAADGLQCIEQLQANFPDLLVLDPEILWGGGAGVIEWLLKERPFNSLKVVLANGRSTKKASRDLGNLAVARVERPSCLADVCSFVDQLEHHLAGDVETLCCSEASHVIPQTPGRRAK